MPLIQMAHGVPFLAINDVLVDARIASQAGTNQRNAELVSMLLAAPRDNAPIDDILSLCNAALGGLLEYQIADATGESPPNATLIAIADDDPGSLSITTAAGNLLACTGSSPAPKADVLGQISRILEIAKHEKDEHENHNRQRIGQLFALVAAGLADSAALIPQLLTAGFVGKPLTISA